MELSSDDVRRDMVKLGKDAGDARDEVAGALDAGPGAIVSCASAVYEYVGDDAWHRFTRSAPAKGPGNTPAEALREYEERIRRNGGHGLPVARPAPQGD